MPQKSAPKPLRSLVVALDLTAVSDRVVGRVERLPLAPDARITLLYVVPETLPASERRRARVRARAALEAEARDLARAHFEKPMIHSVVASGAPAAEIARCADATRAELVVMGRGGTRVLREVFLGSTAERVIRRGRRPVLVVRLRPRAPYRRPAIALDFDDVAPAALSMALRVLPSRPEISLLHAYEVPRVGRFVVGPSEDVEEALRDEHRRRALRMLRKVLAAALAREAVTREESPEWRLEVREGSPRLVVPKFVTRADTDLLILGTRGHAGLTHAFVGSVAGDLLRSVDCDVLVVPPARSRPLE